MQIELRGMYCKDLEQRSPSDMGNCKLNFEAYIGLLNTETFETFRFTVITGAYLVDNPETRWGKGCLIVDRYDWELVEKMVERQVKIVSANSWPEAVAQLRVRMD